MKLKVTQTGGTIHREKSQKLTIEALGLGRINRTRILPDNPAVRGMIQKVIHLVKVEEIAE